MELKEVTNNFNRIQNREAQFQSEMRRKDITIKGFQEQIKKLQDKKAVFKNGVEFTGSLDRSALNISEMFDAKHEFSQMMGQVIN